MRGKLIKIKASYKLSEMVKKEKVSTTTTKAAKVNTKKKPRKTRATKITKAVRNTVLKTGSDRPVRPVQPGTGSQSGLVKKTVWCPVWFLKPWWGNLRLLKRLWRRSWRKLGLTGWRNQLLLSLNSSNRLSLLLLREPRGSLLESVEIR